MLPTEDLFVYVYVLVDDAIGSGAIAIASRPGPVPACSDAELLAIALARRRHDRPRRGWPDPFPGKVTVISSGLNSSSATNAAYTRAGSAPASREV